MRIVDAPGYGFAFAADDAESAALHSMTRDFLSSGVASGRVKLVLLILDARHGVKLPDAEFLRFLRAEAHVGQRRLRIVLNKCDLVPPDKLARVAALVREQTHRGVREPPLFVSSRNAQAIDDIRRELARTVCPSFYTRLLAGAEQREQRDKAQAAIKVSEAEEQERLVRLRYNQKRRRVQKQRRNDLSRK
eukprot:TRINITY_DN1390_c0_g1_i2.p2 TRINITY_DN1390_c0_g1~~TRINITY_DN1390_c0_g1_i2.p2  ORF type:complete len:191 (+),score=88.11 TRINITY_DN1390_c0_g1_i2:106-678(+)